MTKNRNIVVPILINVVIILGLFAFLAISGRNYRDMLLVDDGYYNIARNFVQGDTLLHKFRGPVLPLILSILFIFPESLHPIVRLLISLGMSTGLIILVYNITKDFLSRQQFLIGSLVFILNPVYIHWTFRGAPELLLALFLGLFILCIVHFFRTRRAIHILLASIVFVLSFLVKPVFVFIPIFLLFASLLVKSRKLAFVSLLLVIIGLMAYSVQDQITRVQYSSDAGLIGESVDYKHKIFLITDAFWTDYVLKTNQFYKPTMKEYSMPYKDGKTFNEYVHGWFVDFYQRYPNRSVVFLNLYFIYDKPLLVLQKLIFSPLFYFAMSARTIETFIKLIFSVFSLVLAILGLKVALKEPGSREEITLVIFVIAGLISLHLVSHAMNRYSLPVLPYLYIWAGIPLVQLGTWFRNTLRPRAVAVAHDE